MSKKTTRIIIGVIAAVFVIAAICIIAFSGGKAPETPASGTETTTSDVAVSDVETDEPETSETSGNEFDPDPITDDPIEGSDPDNVLTIPDETAPVVPVTNTTKTSANDPVKPVTEKTPTDDGDGKVSGGITIGTQPEPYNCGTPGHHCDGPETHAYVLNLEKEGCPYCGKSDCASFYATDEWGNTCYTPSKCPKYDIRKDPVYYCQTCGKKCGDGSNGTCVQFVNACNCPNCGEHVDSWTCHTCKN